MQTSSKSMPGHGIQRSQAEPIVNDRGYFYRLTHLPSDVLRHSLEFVGPGHYRLIGGTCRDLLQSYCEVDPERQTTWNNMSASIHSAELCYHDHEKSPESLELIAKTAAANGNLPVIQWAREHGIVWNSVIGAAAASHGQLQVLKYMEKNFLLHPKPSQLLLDSLTKISIGCSVAVVWEMESLGAAAFSGQLDVVRYLHEKGLYDSEVCARAAEGGQVEILRYFYNRGFTFGVNVAEAAAKGGQLATLNYLRAEASCEWNFAACCAAAHAGQFEVVRYLRQHGYIRWSSATFQSAMELGNLEMVRYLFENGCPILGSELTTIRLALEFGHVDVLQYLLMQDGFDLEGAEWLCRDPIEKGDWEILHCLKECWDRWTLRRAIESGHLEMVRNLYENGCEHDSWTFWSAVESGNLEIVQYLFENGCEHDSWAFRTAMDLGHLEIVRYLYDKFDHDYWTFRHAILSGRVEMVQYLFENGCKHYSWLLWKATRLAVDHGHVDVLKYLLKNGFKCDWGICNTAARAEKWEIVDCLKEHGYKEWSDTMYRIFCS